MTDSGDGGLVVAGSREQEYNIVRFLLRLDSEGETVWNKTFGYVFGGDPESIVRTGDDGFMVVGESGVHLLRVDGEGEMILEEEWGGIGGFLAGGTADEYLVGGYTRAYGDRWYLAKFREYVPESVMSLALLSSLLACFHPYPSRLHRDKAD